MVEVTQGDREAAKSLLGRDDAVPSWWSIDSGNADSDPMVQVFATHRTEAVGALEARVRELEGDVRRWKTTSDDHFRNAERLARNLTGSQSHD